MLCYAPKSWQWGIVIQTWIAELFEWVCYLSDDPPVDTRQRCADHGPHDPGGPAPLSQLRSFRTVFASSFFSSDLGHRAPGYSTFKDDSGYKPGWFGNPILRSKWPREKMLQLFTFHLGLPNPGFSTDKLHKNHLSVFPRSSKNTWNSYTRFDVSFCVNWAKGLQLIWQRLPHDIFDHLGKVGGCFMGSEIQLQGTHRWGRNCPTKTAGSTWNSLAMGWVSLTPFDRPYSDQSLFYWPYFGQSLQILLQNWIELWAMKHRRTMRRFFCWQGHSSWAHSGCGAALSFSVGM